MSRKLYLVRHGKPHIDGKKKRCIGLTDVPLSDWGKKDAEIIGQWLADQKIEKIYTSPLSRCTETAVIIKASGVSNSQISVVKDLQEMNVGKWENLTFDEIKVRYADDYNERGKNLGYYPPPEGESFDTAGKRFEKCIDEIRKETDENVLIVAHSGVIRSYLCHLLNISVNEVMSFSQPYCGLTILEENEEVLNPCPQIKNFGWKPYDFLSEEEMKSFYRECGTPENIIRHMKCVAELVLKVKEYFPEDKQKKYDWELLYKAALLHDLTRTERYHPKTGAEFLIKKGYPELAEIIRYHHDTKILDGELTEEEILFYIDKRVLDDRVVSLEERFENSRKKCFVQEALKKHSKLYEKSKLIESKFEAVINIRKEPVKI